jgi:hypothetical protein
MKMALGCLFAAMFGASLLLTLPPAAACNGNGNCDHNHPAPGPIVGAGLPGLAVGYGIFWLVRRRRRAD